MQDNKKVNFKSLFKNSYIIIILAIIYLPVIITIVFSFNKEKSLINLNGLSFRWYETLFSKPSLMDAIIYTFIIALIASLVSTIIGTLAAISLVKYKKRPKEAILAINNIPIVSPEIITALSLFFLFGSFSIQFGLFTVILAHIAFCIPYVIVTVMPKVIGIEDSTLQAAYDLGCNYPKALVKVLIPQIKDAIIAAAVIAFTISFDDFVISYFVAGSSGVQNISIYLYTLKRGINPSINALSTIIIITIMAKVVYDYVTSILKIKKERKQLQYD